MFLWFAKKPKKTAQLMPEGKWLVECDDDTLRATDHKGDVKQLKKTDLTGVIIETNDTGPWGADVWWLLFGADDRVAAAYPQGATGEEAMLNYLTSLPGFDHEKMIEAMQSTDNAVFPVWRQTGRSK
jgi:hypothetical protein